MMGHTPEPAGDSGPDVRKRAVRLVLLFGLVSLLADMTYEGARSVTGPYLALLGASATVVGVVAGMGELVGYGLRVVSGTISDRTKRYWAVTIVGYVVNLLAVPLLALAGSWKMAAGLMVCERIGKAIRAPARDAMLSHATHQTGHGWGFGLHEAMDQIGAVVGPLVVAAVLYRGGGYRAAFALLVVPALMALAALAAARALYPRPRDLEIRTPELEPKRFPRVFWLYLLAVALLAAGYADFPLLAYHFERAAVVPDGVIPLFYALAMGVDAVAAMVFGYLFDRAGVPVLIFSSLVSAFTAPLVFLGGPFPALVGVACWGIGMGAQESIMRAAVARMVGPDRRA